MKRTDAHMQADANTPILPTSSDHSSRQRDVGDRLQVPEQFIRDTDQTVFQNTRGSRMSFVQQLRDFIKPMKRNLFRRACQTACALGLLTSSAMLSNMVSADEPLQDVAYLNDPSGVAVANPHQNRLRPLDPGVGGYGMTGRVVHEAGETVGRTNSITSFDLSPYMFFEETMVFGEGRFFIANSGNVGGSAGFGARRYFNNTNAVGGISFFYDKDNSRGASLEQFGVSGELFTEWLDVRMNYYQPFGRTSQVLGSQLESGSEQFVGNNISFQRRTQTATALEGGDMTFTVPVPGDIAESLNAEASAGWYHYQARGLDLPQVWGWKLRADIDVADKLGHFFAEFTQDKVFNTNVMFGAEVNYRGHLESRPRIGECQYNRIAQFVRRNRTVVANEGSFLNGAELAINPDTNNPYLVYHVRNNPNPPPDNFPFPLGDGSIDTPFQFIREGIDEAPFADIVFVHGDSVYDGNVLANADATAVLRPGLLLLGEGVPLTLPVSGLGQDIALPTASIGNVDLPVIQNVNGPAITMADGSRVAGFNIMSVNGPAILASGIDGGIVDNLSISTTTGINADGLRLLNNTGTFTFENISISGTAGDAINITGGDADYLFDGENTIDNVLGHSVLIRNASGSVNFADMAITDSGLGIEVSGALPGNSTARVTFDEATLTGTNAGVAGAGVLIQNHSSTVAFTGDLTVDANNGDAIVVTGLQSTGRVSFADTTVMNRNAGGVVINPIAEGADPLNPGGFTAGSVIFNNDLTIDGVVGASTAAAISFQSPSGLLRLDGTTTINGSNGRGFDVDTIADTGIVPGAIESTGIINISNTAGTAFNLSSVDKQNFSVTTAGIVINSRGGTGIDINNYNGLTRLNGAVTINNQLASAAPAMTITNNPGEILMGNVNATNVAGPVGVLIQNNVDLGAIVRSRVAMDSLSVDGTSTLGVNMNGNRRVSTGGGTLDIVGGQAIDVLNNELHALVFNSISATNSTFGIRVLDSPGEFMVTGTADIPGSGGTIMGMTVAGALFDNTQVVDLGRMDFTNNEIGIIAQNMLLEPNGLNPFLNMEELTITGSNQEAIFTNDVHTVTLSDSVLANNGAGAGENQIELVASTRELDIDADGTDEIIDYEFTLTGNNISDAIGAAIFIDDMVFIRTNDATIGPDGVDLTLTVTGNGDRVNRVPGFSSNRTLAAAIGVDWTGDVDAIYDNNVFLLNGGNAASPGDFQTGIEMLVDGAANITYSNSTLNSIEDNNTGLNFMIQDSADILIENNVIFDDQGVPVAGSGFLMADFNSRAIDLSLLGTNNDVVIRTNLIEFAQAADGSDGIVFSNIRADADVTIEDNSIQFNNIFFGFLERGIAFDSTIGTIDLFGDLNNQVFFQQNDFSVQEFSGAGPFNGTIIINGTNVP